MILTARLSGIAGLIAAIGVNYSVTAQESEAATAPDVAANFRVLGVDLEPSDGIVSVENRGRRAGFPHRLYFAYRSANNTVSSIVYHIVDPVRVRGGQEQNLSLIYHTHYTYSSTHPEFGRFLRRTASGDSISVSYETLNGREKNARVTIPIDAATDFICRTNRLPARREGNCQVEVVQ